MKKLKAFFNREAPRSMNDVKRKIAKAMTYETGRTNEFGGAIHFVTVMGIAYPAFLFLPVAVGYVLCGVMGAVSSTTSIKMEPTLKKWRALPNQHIKPEIKKAAV